MAKRKAWSGHLGGVLKGHGPRHPRDTECDITRDIDNVSMVANLQRLSLGNCCLVSLPSHRLSRTVALERDGSSFGRQSAGAAALWLCPCLY